MDLLDDNEFDRKFDALTRRLAPLRELHPEIGMDDKVGVKARLDLMVLECLPEQMNVDEMMVISRAAFDAIMLKWKEWLQKGQS